MPPVPSYAKPYNATNAQSDEALIQQLIDAGLVAHLGFVADGRPMVVPLAYARDGQQIYLHGATKTRFLKLCRDKAPLCLTITLLDGLVVARSAFNHSVNYRSVMLHGHGRLVEDPAEKDKALDLLTNHLLPGRSQEVRPMLDKERKATGVIAFTIEAATAKTRSGPPTVAAEDQGLNLWSGILPITTAIARGVPDHYTSGEMAEPASLSKARQKFVV